MGVFEQFPYANMHEMNLDWLLKKMKELIQAMETFKATESLKFADPIIWDITTQYQKSTIVIDPSGNAYLSKEVVPSGVQLNNTDYWLEIFNFTDYTRTANRNLTVNVETNTTRATATYQVDDWLIWEDVLYRVTAAIAIDDALIVAPAAGSNIVHFTVEDFIKAFITYATNLINQYKNDIDASELAYQAAMQAEVDRILAGATVDSEVIDARLGFNNVEYTTLGNAIRGTDTLLNDQIVSNTHGLNTPSIKNANYAPPTAMYNLAVSDEDGNALLMVDRYNNIATKKFNSENVDAINQNWYGVDTIDFAFCDGNNNIAFMIRNGLPIINQRLVGKKVSIIGDSISTYDGWIPEGYATYYPHGNLDTVRETWWWRVINDLNLQLLVNASWSASRVTGDSQGTAYCACSDARIADIKGADNTPPDIVLCYISTNDWAGNKAVGSFDSTDDIPTEGVIDEIAPAYALMLYKIRTTYPNAQIYCITSLEGRTRTGDTSYPIINTKGETIHEVNHAIAEVAHIFGCHVIDLQTSGIHYWNIASYTVDGYLHPNAKGAALISRIVEMELEKTYCK